MPYRIVLLFALVLPATAAQAGPNAGGVLLLHANTSITYTSESTDYCGQSDLAACSLAVTSVPWDPETTTVFHVLAAFADTASPRLKALSFGIDWDPENLYIAAHGPCADFDLPDNAWPDPGTGIGLSWTSARTDSLVEAYWFAAYAYAAGDGPDTTSVALIPHPAQGAVMVDDAVPPNEDEIAALGRLGFGTMGDPACPSAGADLPPPEGGAEGTEGDELGEDPESVTVLPDWICTGTDRWTILVSGIPPSEIQSMTLRIGEGQYAPVGHEATGDGTSLWDFRYPKGLRTTTASLQVSATGRGEIASPLVVKETSTFPDPDSVTVQGSVSVKLVPRVIRWEVRHDGNLYLRASRSIHELEIADPRFRSLLLALGVHTVWRASALSADGDSIAVLPNNRTLAVLPFQRSAYGLRFNPAHSAEAIGAILTTSSRVLSARSSHVRIESRAQGPCAGSVTNTPYPAQWELKSWIEGSPYGTEVNWAWCSNMGIGQRIYLLDHPVDFSSTTISARIDPRATQYPSDGDDHGSICAQLAVGSIGGSCSVGAAPEATLYPVYLYGSDTWEWISNCLDEVRQAHAGAAVEIVCIPADVDPGTEYYGEFAAICQAMNDEGLLLIAAMKEADDRPAQFFLTLSVGGIDASGTTHGAGFPNVRAPWGPFATDGKFVFPYCGAGAEVGTSFATALAAGCAALLQNVLCATTATALHDAMFDAAPNWTTKHLQMGYPCGYTGVNDITNVYALGGPEEVYLYWTVLDAEGILQFDIYEAATCWGPFAHRQTVWPDGEGEYIAIVEAPYQRSHYLKLGAVGSGGERAEYTAQAAPTSGIAPPAVPTPTDVFFEGQVNDATIWWLKDGYPSSTDFWIYRGATEDMAECGWDGRWGNWYHGVVSAGLPSCFQLRDDWFACWFDHDLLPGMPYTYRIAAAQRDSQDRIMAVSGLSDPVTGYGVTPAGVSGLLASDATFGRVLPNPVMSGQAFTYKPVLGDGELLRVRIFDISGRELRGFGVERPMAASGQGVTLDSRLPDGSTLSPGMYLLLAETDGIKRHVDRLVVIR